MTVQEIDDCIVQTAYDFKATTGKYPNYLSISLPDYETLCRDDNAPNGIVRYVYDIDMPPLTVKVTGKGTAIQVSHRYA